MEEQNPVVDWSLAIKVVGDKKELAEDLFECFKAQLPEDFDKIQITYRQKDFDVLLKYVHKMHGALCYLGLPRLQAVVAQLEDALKQNRLDGMPQLMNQFDQEVALLLQYK